MKNIYLGHSIIFLMILIIIFYSSYNPGKGLTEAAYVIAIGLDVGQTNSLKLSIQISDPSSSSNSDSSSSSQSSDSILETIECSSISSGLNLFNSYLSKEINLSHCKILVISEELASKDISEYLYTLMNNIEFRSDANLIISKCSSEMFLKSSKPSLEQLSARYYESISTSSDNTGYTSNITFGDFFSAHTNLFAEPVAILGSVNTKNSQDLLASDLNSSNKSNRSSSSIFSATSKDSSYVAGQTPVESKNSIENLGLAVFNNGKVIGELNSIESLCYLIISNKLKIGQITIPSPLSSEEFIDLSIKLNKKPKISVDLINGSPFIKVNVKLSSRMLSMNKNSNILDNKNIELIEEYTNRYLEESITSYLYKISKVYKSDINGFGKYAVKNFLFWNDWTDYNWLHNFPSSSFTVNVESNFKSSYLLMEI